MNTKTNPMDSEPDKQATTQPVGKVEPPKPETAVLQSSKRWIHGKSSDGTKSLHSQRELLLVIRGMVERLVLPDNMTVVLGRTDLNARYHPDVDLTPYGALDRGVSRSHVRLHVDDDKLYVTDLGSTNGTFLAGKRLEPETPTILHKGDELTLGRLTMQILFN